MIKKTIGRLILILVLAAMLPAVSACGKKSSLDPPPGKESDYPRTYPTR